MGLCGTVVVSVHVLPWPRINLLIYIVENMWYVTNRDGVI